VASVEAVGVVALIVARQLHAVAIHLAGEFDCLIEQLAADAGVPQIVADVHRLDLGAPATTMLDVAERDHLDHADHVDAVVDGDEHRGPLTFQDLAERVHIFVPALGRVIIVREFAADDQLDQRVDIVEGCRAERDVQFTRQ
jgi:hypothetical protein